MSAKFDSLFLFNTYRPMALTDIGRKRALEHELPAFIDGSFRREPDFQMNHPSISALCRKGHFAPKLDVGHSIVYCAKKEQYKSNTPFWCLVAMLKVIQRFENHNDAAAWYLKNEGRLPSNCMVSGNQPQDFDKTLGFKNPNKRNDFSQNPRLLERWDNDYRKRAQLNPDFLACDIIEIERTDPFVITSEMVSDECPSHSLPNSFLNHYHITEDDWEWFRNVFQTGKRLSEY